MYVCLCTGVTDTQIRETLSEGACSVEEVMYCTGAGTRCGSCVSAIAEMVLEHNPDEQENTGLRRRLAVIRPVNSAA